MEETNYPRRSILADETQNLAVGLSTNPTDNENVSPVSTSGQKAEVKSSYSHTSNANNVRTKEQLLMDQSSPAPSYRPKTYRQKLRIFGKRQPITHFWSMVLRPIRLMRYPVILYCAFSYGGSLIWYSVLNATASLVLSAPPYNFSP